MTTTAIIDNFPQLRQHKKMVVTGTCTVMFLLGLPMCTQRGINVLDLWDTYSSMWSLTLLMFSETVLVVFVYG